MLHQVGDALLTLTLINCKRAARGSKGQAMVWANGSGRVAAQPAGQTASARSNRSSWLAMLATRTEQDLPRRTVSMACELAAHQQHTMESARQPGSQAAASQAGSQQTRR